MRFLKFKASNYKSFLESPELSFRPGLNVIVGQNNSGKTALLEAMTLAYGDNHHRSLETMPRTTTSPNPQSKYEFVFEVDAVEARTLMLDQFPTAYVAIPEKQPLGIEADKVASIINSTFAVRATYSASPGVSEAFLEAFPASLSSPHVVKCVVQIGGISVDRNTVHGASPGDRLPFRLVNVFRPRIYAFRAERQNVGECAIADSPVLEPNASNLASVLLLLQSNNSRFRRYESFVKNIFPQIKQITVRPVGGRARILVWTVQPESERIDLAFALAECGTGIGQVLSMLYVVLTAEQPRALLIDEPQSFLHPGAIRKLLEIFAAHPQHQYIITTHSPTALASFPPSTLTLLTMDGPKSIARQVNPTEATELRAVLAEVGARLSDVFGADNILWVEGATEEACFPLIRAKGRRDTDVATGTIFLGVRHTSDFRPRDAGAAVEIHHRLSKARALMPPAVGFIFDPEGLSGEAQLEIRHRSGDLVRFLSRRMFENYLLNPDGIAFAINSLDDLRTTPIQTSDVSGWIAHHKWDPQYFEGRVIPAPRTEGVWLKTVHAAHLLRDVFSELSEQRVLYDKVRDGVKLTTWICENDLGAFAEIVDLIRESVAKDGTPA